MIYLDNAATTKMYEKGADIYKLYACQSFFNPSANYKEALKIDEELMQVRKHLLLKLGARQGNIIFTSGATESNNLAIMGSKRNGKCEYVFSEGEHPSVYNVAKELSMQGYIVHFVKLQRNGEVDYSQLESVLNQNTRLISVMHASNETGAINDLMKINMLRKKIAPSALFHVDGVQAFCKLNYKIDDYGIDLYTISAHKFHGPKGVGALYVRSLQGLKNIVFGGGQEGGYRSGTENVPGIMAMDYAVQNTDTVKNLEKVSKLYNLMITTLEKDEKVNIIKTKNPFIINAGFKGVNGETLMRVLQDNGVLVSKGSACSSKKAGNRILESMGFEKEDIKTHIRISLDASLEEKEILVAGETILKLYNELWEKLK